MKKIEIFDPAMCCSTGVCGTSVDPELARIASDLNGLKKQGIEVVRYNMGQEPLAFVENVEIGKLLQEQGPDVLPVTIVNTVVVKTKEYPTKEELESWLDSDNASDSNQIFSEQIRELIAIGAAIAASCEPCFKFHYDKARKLGVSNKEMLEAVEIGAAVKNASSKNIYSLAERYLVDKKDTPKTTDSASCGGSEDGGKCC